METSNKTKWVIDPAHSEIGFKVKHLMITNVKGMFKEYEGTVTTTGDDFSTAEISLKINTASIDTGVADRDGHLKSPDFFNVEKSAEMTFTSGKLAKTLDNEFTLTGDLTILGITKPVSLQVEFAGLMTDPWGNKKAGFVLNGKISRKDWGLNWNAALETGGWLVSDEVRLNMEVQLRKVEG
jgi:polyisoprenoid-binding protein YceI